MTADQPYLARITLFPLKSLDGIEVPQAIVLPSGALQRDREFALLDERGQFINGKRNAKVHLLRSEFDLEQHRLTIRRPDNEQPAQFHLNHDRLLLEQWLAGYFAMPVRLVQDLQRGFPDDTHAPGPTLVSTATLATIAAWFPGLSPDHIRRRVRANLEIDGVPPFWEDQLFGADQPVLFQIGEVVFEGVNPCQRCVVLTRDAVTGEAWPNFQRQFVERRRATLPDWADQSRFNHFFRLAVNTRVPTTEGGKGLRQGDGVRLF
ncbi:MAG: MOSC N-terminal beta barrel domain-containing protein [Synechococcales cyanobacterium C42_A2020_086]|jgi:uncharacterized protein YcbX|nr:MOSC N-terminal beta barrel domain-containing protein [Synechococcales cyanobacterium C42_A2020_086]